ncbi:hypothetical protein MIDIC_570001 [Alphaproteobacteria bacterium]
MGELALIDAGYYNKDILSNPKAKRNDWSGTWTGKNGVNSRDDFLNSAEAQTQAVKDYHSIVWHRYLKKYHESVGEKMGKVEITASGLIAATHLAGLRKVKDWLDSDGKTECSDHNENPKARVTCLDYLKRFQNYDMKDLPEPPKKDHSKENKAPALQGYITTKNNIEKQSDALIQEKRAELLEKLEKFQKVEKQIARQELDAAVDKKAAEFQKDLNHELSSPLAARDTQCDARKAAAEASINPCGPHNGVETGRTAGPGVITIHYECTAHYDCSDLSQRYSDQAKVFETKFNNLLQQEKGKLEEAKNTELQAKINREVELYNQLLDAYRLGVIYDEKEKLSDLTHYVQSQYDINMVVNDVVNHPSKSEETAHKTEL